MSKSYLANCVECDCPIWIDEDEEKLIFTGQHICTPPNTKEVNEVLLNNWGVTYEEAYQNQS